ncbi:MAG TPA: 4Fe-4S dicluster domain-containing protein [Tepidisphaeraceae bacterium]|jgi:electron transport complex protein RnfC
MTIAAPGEASALRMLDLPARLRIPLGTRPPVAMPDGIAIGTTVAKGQPLAAAPVEAGPAALAPTSGRIVGVSDVTLTNGQVVPAVELEADFQDRWLIPPAAEESEAATVTAASRETEPLDKVTPDDLGQWIDRLRAAGAWADRLHSPDLLGQLHQVLRRPIDTLVCNLVDHDPMLRLQAAVAARFGPVLIEGVALLARLTSARNVWIAVEAGAAPKWWLPLRRELRKASIDVVPLLADYPQADPSLLTYTLLRRRLRPGRLPVEKGVMILDAVSAIAIGRAAARAQPMLQTPVAVRDHLRARSHLLVTPVGTSVRHVLEQLRLPHEGVTILRGDVLRDQPVSPDAVIAGGELTLHVLPAAAPAIPDPCIRCGWCVQTCPTQVQPAGLLEAAQRADADMAEHYGLDACIECGICAYMCPSHLPLLQGVRSLKHNRREQR